MKIACSTAGFKEPLEVALPKIAGLGFQFVDLIAIGGWPHIDVEALASDFETEAGRVEALVQKSGLTPVAMNCAFPPNAHQRGDAAANAARIKKAEATARLAARLGVKVAGMYPGYQCPDRPWKDVLRDSIATYREILAAGEKHGVRFVVEPHWATPFQTLDQARGLLEDMPGLRVTFDPTHFIHQGVPLSDCTWMIARAAHAHVRDVNRERLHAPCGTGDMDFEAMVRALTERGYSGVLSIECLPMEGADVCEDIAKIRDRLTEALAPLKAP